MKKFMTFMTAIFLVSFCWGCNAVTPGPSTTRSSAAVIAVTEAEESPDGSGDSLEQQIQEETTVPETQEETTTEEETEALNVELVYAISAVNIRDAASSSNSNVVGTLQAGESAIKLGEENGWIMIEYNGDACYVYSDYISEEAP